MASLSLLQRYGVYLLVLFAVALLIYILISLIQSFSMEQADRKIREFCDDKYRGSMQPGRSKRVGKHRTRYRYCKRRDATVCIFQESCAEPD